MVVPIEQRPCIWGPSRVLESRPAASFGANVPFQKQLDPGSNPETTFARSILAYIESKGRANASCIGLSLWVRADNERARAMYEALGFGYDPSGPFDDDGLETYEMRKWFAA